jgi:hypothetical protein
MSLQIMISSRANKKQWPDGLPCEHLHRLTQMFIEKLGGEDKENASRDLNEIETYVTDKSA